MFSNGKNQLLTGMFSFQREIKENGTKEQSDFVQLGSVLDIMKCHGQVYGAANNVSFEVLHLFSLTYYCFYLVIPGPPGAGELNR